MNPLPSHPEAAAETDLGLRAIQSSRPDLALLHFSRAASLAPDVPEYHGNLGNVLLTLGQTNAAIAAFAKAVELRPASARFHDHLGCALMADKQSDAAVASLTKAVELKPANPQFHKHLAIALHDSGQYDQSIAHLTRSLQLNPDDPQSHWTLGILHLLQGDFAKGWPEFDWRWKDPASGLARDFPAPLWSGEDLSDKTILLHAEQGLGDTIQFIRYAPLVAERSANVILECQPDLTHLLQNFPGIQKVYPRDATLPPFDFHCPLMRLPLIFNTTLDSIPAATPYLTPRTTQILPRETLNIGLAWAGRPEHPNDKNRSLSLSQFAPLANLPGVAFFSLQKGQAATQPGLTLTTQPLADLADTAALISSLDMVITVDTAIAHLAGALNKPTAVLLPYVPDWRWLLNRADSPWYPSLTLFRQESPNQWNDVMTRVRDYVISAQKKRGRCSP